MDNRLIGCTIKSCYKIIDTLREGDLSTTYIARDLRNNLIYSLKIMHREFSDASEFLTRFQREAAILRQLNNPHIIRAIDYGEDHGIYFIVMDYVDGQSLKYIISENGAFKTLQALDYLQQIADALKAANIFGIVHRNIRPQDIVINARDVVKIIDFSLANGGDRESFGDMFTITHTDKFMGTAFYIAPEQVESSHTVDTRADLYSLSAVFFEMLSGRPPYTKGSALDIIMKHIHEPVPSICLLRPDLPSEMDLFIRKALAKSPDARFQTPAEYIDAIERLQKHIRGGEPQNEKQASLVLLEDGRIYPLRRTMSVVGREDPRREIHPDIVLDDEKKTVGRIHACITCQQGQWSIEDRNSRNKTRLNGIVLIPFEPNPLKDGDRLRFGRVEARFELR